MRRLIEYPRWIGAMLGVIMVAVIWPIVEEAWQRATAVPPEPASAWMEVHSIAVSDAVEGDRHAVFVDRDIYRNFTADWIVTVRRSTPHGFEVFCGRPGKSDYLAGAAAPMDRTIRWWMGSPPNAPCDPYPPGQYILSIAWTIHTDEGHRYVSATSNVFNAIPRGRGR